LALRHQERYDAVVNANRRGRNRTRTIRPSTPSRISIIVDGSASFHHGSSGRPAQNAP
jgi:hypothetical protein